MCIRDRSWTRRRSRKRQPSVAGTYVDVLVRTPDGWRFRERRLVHDLVAALGLNVPDAQKR